MLRDSFVVRSINSISWFKYFWFKKRNSFYKKIKFRVLILKLLIYLISSSFVNNEIIDINQI